MENVLFHKVKRLHQENQVKEENWGPQELSGFFQALLEVALTGSDVDYNLGQNCQATFFLGLGVKYMFIK